MNDTRRCIAMIALFLVCNIRLQAQELPPLDSYGDRVRVQKDIPFGKSGQEHQKLDLYLPKGDGPIPVVVCWYGGGFTGGNRSSTARICAFLADKGLAAAAPGYLLARPKDGVQAWPNNLHDAKCAVRFLRANAKEYHLDGQRIAGLGHSAGAYLALMVGFTPELKELDGKDGWLEHSSRLSAIVNIAGVSDRRGRLGMNSKDLLGKGSEVNFDLRRLASPVVHINKQSPPVYTLHGDQDKVVVPESAKQLDEALKKVGIEHELRIMRGAGHNPIDAETMVPVAAWLTKKLALKK